MKLISMTDFVLQQDKLMRHQLNDTITFTMKVTDYALFLKKPLTLGMFVPCDSDGNVLEEPMNCNCAGYSKYCFGCSDNNTDFSVAQSKVLFKNFYWNSAEFCDKEMLELHDNNNNYLLYDYETKEFKSANEKFFNLIEELCFDDYNIDLAVSF